MPPVIVSYPSPSHRVREAIIAPLMAHNERMGMHREGEYVAYALVDSDHAIAGGVLAYWKDLWLFVESLSVREDLRGQGWGRALLTEAESEAQAKGAVGVWLDTHDFQAPNFYPKLGYHEIGRLPNYFPGLDRIWFAKRFPAP